MVYAMPRSKPITAPKAPPSAKKTADRAINSRRLNLRWKGLVIGDYYTPEGPRQGKSLKKENLFSLGNPPAAESLAYGKAKTRQLGLEAQGEHQSQNHKDRGRISSSSENLSPKISN